ncbi:MULTISPECIES: peroxidase family protein [Okeania]|uniref:Peroxiredoxin n=2 Tax=Okeania TaxID=1458928 RepID=A0A3N6PIS3_9CYAN|nr:MULTISPECIES: peroxidase family protein [Okeania]NES78053.1 peroxiredoxin [Okeania sp. SIO1H4]NET23023.1 peroxiredoxin [Okeania sp. SIO1H5]NET96505.1 peroxiredoxin [Okeania sp. SIO1H2]RQH25812.1 peroxiredoxin [Okeania hirsuta]RQH38945.1 peroxiredoxin [Okeania hirsuta]
MDDNYEKNNRIQQAFDFSENEQTLLSDINGLGVALDDDLYKIEATEGSLDIFVELTFNHNEGNLDLFLLDSTGNEIASSDSLDDNEIIDFTVDKAGTYYIQVTSGDGTFSGNTYDLLWDDVIGENTFRTINGLNNNLQNPEFGSATEKGTRYTQLLRLGPEAYEDGLSEPRGGGLTTPLELPSARAVSNAIADQGEESIVNDFKLSDWFWQWGQFIDHDIDLTEADSSGDSFPIQVPTGDPDFDPFGTGTQTIPLTRSIFDPATGTTNPREQINEITAFLDGSMVYGSDEATALSLRADDGTGKLATSIGPDGEILLPTDSDGNFLAGDIRVNEQLGLISVHTLFVREHNRLADEITDVLDNGNGSKADKLNELFEESGLSRGDFIYESARRLVGAKIQTITYNEFLPLLLGKDALGEYTGYDETLEPGIFTEFSTGVFRFGHTMLSPQLLQVEEDGSYEAVALRDAFFQPSKIMEDGVDSLLKGLESQQAQAVDNFLIDDVRNFLFGPPGAGGFDLASLNIQRGRENGVADINTVRNAIGLSSYTDFDELTGGNSELAAKFASVYDSIDDVDLWIGGLAEQDINGGVVGETISAIIIKQFTNLRDGDRFYVKNDPYLKELEGIIDKNLDNVSLADIIEDNSDVKIVASAFTVNNPIVV